MMALNSVVKVISSPSALHKSMLSFLPIMKDRIVRSIRTA